ncbi:MAG TPA: TrmJ/YjtD family RNA methyltransferase [Thermoplasmata archaeon]|nr:TrmJ/YjtD family RNA methyltransferase [Thermoplasmata archaeon]
MTARFHVVLLRPKEDGNVGAIARVARNFGAEELIIVAPRARLGPEARRRAMGGLALLKNARVVRALPEALTGMDLIVGSTDTSTGRSNAYLRRSVSPERLGEMLRPVEGDVAVLLGPEDNGLSRTELASCDVLVHVPARREFPTLNVSHAAGLILYGLHRAQSTPDPQSTPAPDVLELNGREKELLLARLSDLAQSTGYPAHKRKGLVLLFRRLLGRSVPTEAELRMLLGFFRGIHRGYRKTDG